MKLDLERALMLMIHVHKEYVQNLEGCEFSEIESMKQIDDVWYDQYGVGYNDIIDWYIEKNKSDIVKAAKDKLSDEELEVLGLTR